MATIGLIVMGMIARTLAYPDGGILLALTLAALIFFSWLSIRLKFVRVDHNTLYVLGWFKRSAIPLTEIEQVHYSGGVGLVFVRLKSASDFGRTIAFMPTFGARTLSMLGSRSIAEELRDLAKSASTDSENAI